MIRPTTLLVALALIATLVLTPATAAADPVADTTAHSSSLAISSHDGGATGVTVAEIPDRPQRPNCESGHAICLDT